MRSPKSPQSHLGHSLKTRSRPGTLGKFGGRIKMDPKKRQTYLVASGGRHFRPTSCERHCRVYDLEFDEIRLNRPQCRCRAGVHPLVVGLGGGQRPRRAPVLVIASLLKKNLFVQKPWGTSQTLAYNDPGGRGCVGEGNARAGSERGLT